MRIARQAGFRMYGPGGRRPPGGSGFTLAEVLVAVGVLLVAFLGVITVYLVGHGDITEGGHDTVAAVAAQSLVEGLRNLPKSDPQLGTYLANMNGVDTANLASCPANPASLNTLCTGWAAAVNQQLPQGRGTVTVVQSNPIPGNTFSTITVNMFWTDPSRGARQLVVVAGRAS